MCQFKLFDLLSSGIQHAFADICTLGAEEVRGKLKQKIASACGDIEIPAFVFSIGQGFLDEGSRITRPELVVVDSLSLKPKYVHMFKLNLL